MLQNLLPVTSTKNNPDIGLIMCNSLESQSHIDDLFALVDEQDVCRDPNYKIKVWESRSTGQWLDAKTTEN